MIEWKEEQGKVLDLTRSIINGNLNTSFYGMSLSISDTLKKPIMKDVFKGELAEVSFEVVGVLVEKFLNSFAFSTKLGEAQIDEFTAHTLENFSHESLDDIILFFKMASSGKFGETNRGVDANLVFGKWFPIYMDLKALERKKVHDDQKNKRSENIVSIEAINKIYANVQREKIYREKVRKAKLFVDKVSKDFDKQMLEDTITEWSKDSKKDYYTNLLKKKRRTIK